MGDIISTGKAALDSLSESAKKVGDLISQNAKQTYQDMDTGDLFASDEELDSQGNPKTQANSNQSAQSNSANNALGSETEAAYATPKQGNTSKIPNEGEIDFSEESQYGTQALKSRKFDIKDPETTIEGKEVVASKANKWTLHNYRAYYGGTVYGDPDYENYNKATIQGGEENILAPTARKIVTYAEGIQSLSFDYGFQDFVTCEHYGQISNDYMITLRRFPYPIGDDILNVKELDDKGKEIDTGQPDLARAITWLSPKLGNNLGEILGFGTGLGWKDVESEVQTATAASGQKQRGKLGGIIDGSKLGSAIESGINGYSASQAATIREKGQYDPLGETYPNMVYGPLNAIKKVLARDDKGLKFDSEFNLTFYYDLRGSDFGDATSPRVLFMDTLSNMLALTYNNAPFWGGATRYQGSGHVGKPFGDFKKLQSGDYAGFLGSLATQLKSSLGAAFDDIGKAASGLMSGKGLNALGDSKIMDNIIGGGLMKMFNSPQGGETIKAFLTGDPTGQWHITVGNPMNPIMVCGNLCLQDSKFEFDGPLGYEGFPTKLKVTLKLAPGRPRDKSEIEGMFNQGRGRMYLQPDALGAVDVNQMNDVSAYGNKDRKLAGMNKDFAEKISNMSAG